MYFGNIYSGLRRIRIVPWGHPQRGTAEQWPEVRPGWKVLELCPLKGSDWRGPSHGGSGQNSDRIEIVNKNNQCP